MTNELFTRKEVAAIFRIKPRTIWHWEKKGLIKPDHFINGRPRYSLREIEKVAAEKETVFTYKKTIANYATVKPVEIINNQNSNL